MKIRLAQDKDYAGIARLHRATVRSVNAKDYPQDIIEIWSMRSSAQRFRGNEDRCKRWVAVEGDKVIGFVDHSLDGELWGLYVHKDYIGEGIGSRLLGIAEDSIKKAGRKEIILKSTITARGFYQKHGYEVVKKFLHPMGDKKLEIYLMKKAIGSR